MAGHLFQKYLFDIQHVLLLVYLIFNHLVFDFWHLIFDFYNLIFDFIYLIFVLFIW